MICIKHRFVVGNGFKPFCTSQSFRTTKLHTSLSEIVRGFKTFSSRKIHEKYKNKIFQWQKSFYDHIIRDEISLNHIREYICSNPLK